MFFIRFLKQRCALCNAPLTHSAFLCHDCKRSLVLMDSIPHCKRCATPLPAAIKTGTVPVCGHCLKAPPFFQETHAAYRYQGKMLELIHQLKFGERLVTLPFFVDSMKTLLINHYQNRPFPDLLISTPLAYVRQFKRGYNQTHEIARRLARVLSMPYSPHLLKKIKHTKAQAGLTRRRREKNIKGSFEVSLPIPKIKSIALLDDVMTTGATLREMSKILYKAGIKEVHLWVVARTGQD